MPTRTRPKDNVLSHGDPVIESPIPRNSMVIVEPSGDVRANPGDSLEKPLTESGDISDADELEELHETDAEIRRKLSELDIQEGAAQVRIWRAHLGNPREMAFVDELQLSEYSYKFLCDTYGGGLFNIKVYVPKWDETGTAQGVKLIVNKRFRIEGKPKEPKRDEIIPTSGASDFLQLGKLMNDGIQSLGRLIIENRPREKSTLDFAKELATIKSLFVDNNASKQPDPFIMIERMAGAMQQLRPAGEGEGGAMAEMVRMFGPLIRDSVMRQPANAPAPESAPALASLGAPEAEPETNSAPNLDIPDDMNPADLIYKGYVMLLVQHARSNNPTEPIAAQILNEAPEDFIDWIVKQADPIPTLARYHKNVTNFPDWFRRLHADIVRLDKDETGTPAA